MKSVKFSACSVVYYDTMRSSALAANKTFVMVPKAVIRIMNLL